MRGNRLETGQMMELLAATPGRISELTGGVSTEALSAEPAPGEWPASYILAHLRACADVAGQAIAALLAGNQTRIRTVSPRTYIKRTDYPELPFEKSLRAFAEQRAALVAILETRTDADWARSAIFTGRGDPVERSLRFHAEQVAVHERAHLEQIENALKALGY